MSDDFETDPREVLLGHCQKCVDHAVQYGFRKLHLCLCARCKQTCAECKSVAPPTEIERLTEQLAAATELDQQRQSIIDGLQRDYTLVSDALAAVTREREHANDLLSACRDRCAQLEARVEHVERDFARLNAEEQAVRTERDELKARIVKALTDLAMSPVIMFLEIDGPIIDKRTVAYCARLVEEMLLMRIAELEAGKLATLDGAAGGSAKEINT